MCTYVIDHGGDDESQEMNGWSRKHIGKLCLRVVV